VQSGVVSEERMPPKSRKRKIAKVTEKEETHAVIVMEEKKSNMQNKICKSSIFELPLTVHVDPSATVCVGYQDELPLECMQVVCISTNKTSCTVTMSSPNNNELKSEVEISSINYKSFRVSSSFLLLIFADKFASFCRETGEFLTVIDLVDNVPSSDDCIVMTDKEIVVVISASTITTIPYGSSISPAALNCRLYNCRTGEFVTEYEIAFERVAYFPNTLKAHSRGEFLMVSCWDDMQLKVVDLMSGNELYVLEKNEETESRCESSVGGLCATVKALCIGKDYIAVGYEWQRYIKASPLRVYDTNTGERIHCLAANGASPLCLAIHDQDKLLFSAAANAKEVRVWNMVDGTRLYSLPCIQKVIDFTLRPENNTLYVRTNSTGFTFWSSNGPRMIESDVCDQTTSCVLWDFNNDDDDVGN
jgi:WD40 repeat protein